MSASPLAALAAGLSAAAAAGGGGSTPPPRLTYLQHCAGCHGLDGRSVSRVVPDLKGRAGWFLCNAQGRDYMARLPNVIFSGVSPADRASLLNYVAFSLGEGSAPEGSRGYTAAETARLGAAPLSSVDLKGYRRGVLDKLVRQCGAPEQWRTEYGASP